MLLEYMFKKEKKSNCAVRTSRAVATGLSGTLSWSIIRGGQSDAKF